jgi:hypothetical protein
MVQRVSESNRFAMLMKGSGGRSHKMVVVEDQACRAHSRRTPASSLPRPSRATDASGKISNSLHDVLFTAPAPGALRTLPALSALLAACIDARERWPPSPRPTPSARSRSSTSPSAARPPGASYSHSTTTSCQRRPRTSVRVEECVSVRRLMRRRGAVHGREGRRRGGEAAHIRRLWVPPRHSQVRANLKESIIRAIWNTPSGQVHVPGR